MSLNVRLYTSYEPDISDTFLKILETPSLTHPPRVRDGFFVYTLRLFVFKISNTLLTKNVKSVSLSILNMFRHATFVDNRLNKRG